MARIQPLSGPLRRRCRGQGIPTPDRGRADANYSPRTIRGDVPRSKPRVCWHDGVVAQGEVGGGGDRLVGVGDEFAGRPGRRRRRQSARRPEGLPRSMPDSSSAPAAACWSRISAPPTARPSTARSSSPGSPRELRAGDVIGLGDSSLEVRKAPPGAASRDADLRPVRRRRRRRTPRGSAPVEQAARRLRSARRRAGLRGPPRPRRSSTTGRGCRYRRRAVDRPRPPATTSSSQSTVAAPARRDPRRGRPPLPRRSRRGDGTLLNGERLRDESRWLNSGDTIEVGGESLRFVAGERTRIGGGAGRRRPPARRSSTSEGDADDRPRPGQRRRPRRPERLPLPRRGPRARRRRRRAARPRLAQRHPPRRRVRQAARPARRRAPRSASGRSGSSSTAPASSAATTAARCGCAPRASRCTIKDKLILNRASIAIEPGEFVVDDRRERLRQDDADQGARRASPARPAGRVAGQRRAGPRPGSPTSATSPRTRSSTGG